MSKDFKMTPSPELMGDTGIHRLFGDEIKRAEGLAGVLDKVEKVMHQPPEPTNVPELFFHTKKRHRPDIYECNACNYQFPKEVACPKCGSTDMVLFMRAPSRAALRVGRDHEAELNDLDPDWRERFGGDAERAMDFYKPPHGRIVNLGNPESPPEVIDDGVTFDDDLEDR